MRGVERIQITLKAGHHLPTNETSFKQSSDVISVMFCCMNRKEEMLIFIRVFF